MSIDGDVHKSPLPNFRLPWQPWKTNPLKYRDLRA